ncbi:MAG: urease accessory protein UreD [Aquincola sp.]|nr:urease accessory protein UreD [Aquincola sp.]MDH5329715.1 urease accessory protein UreD [Aquincola sp.]
MSAPSWRGHLALDYRRDGDGRCVASDRHHGPLRVLKALYPEGPGICHHVLVHPPGGMAGGDALDIDITLGPQTHALITTPGATRFYRSAGRPASQTVRIDVQRDARLEWLPMASLAYDGCLAENRVCFALADGAAMIGADLLCLGLPASGAPFTSGRFTQHLEWPGRWLERGVIDAGDWRLLDSPLGLAGRKVMATLWCASGSGFTTAERDALLDVARDNAPGLEGCTAPAPGLVVWRTLGDAMESTWARLVGLRARWRRLCWDLDEHAPRVWST